MFAQYLAAGCYAGIYALGLLRRDERVSGLGLAALAGTAGITSLARYQTTGMVVYLVAGFGAVFPFAAGWKRFTGQWPRRERRALAQLFGEETLWQMLFRDSRLKTWRQPR